MDYKTYFAKKINLKVATPFKLAVGVLPIFVVCGSFGMDKSYALWIGVAGCVIGGTIGMLKYKSIGFYLLSIALGFIMFSNSNIEPLATINHSLSPQHATINGKVKSILNRQTDKRRIIVEGDFTSKTLPTTHNTAILLTIIGTINENIDIEIGDKVIIDAHIRPPKEKVFEYDFNEVIYNKSIGTSWTGYANSENVYKKENANYVQQIINTSYNNISEQVDSIFTMQTASFVKAILLADKTGLSYEDKNKFAFAGVAHILAISGFHIGIISAVILFLLSLFTPNGWTKFIIFSIFVSLFVFLTGFQPATIRAGAMAILFIFGRTINKETSMLNVASMVLLASALINPNLLHSVGFQLSFIAILGIFLFNDIIISRFGYFAESPQSGIIIPQSRIKSHQGGIKSPLSRDKVHKVELKSHKVELKVHKVELKDHFQEISSTFKKYFKSYDFSNNILPLITLNLAISIVLTPLIAHYFNIFSIISPLTNLLVIPLFSLCLVFAVISIILSYIYFPLGLIYGYVVEVLTKLCFEITCIAADFKYSAVIDNSNLLIISVIISLCIIYIFVSNNSKQIIFRLCVSVFIVTLSVFTFNNERPNELKLYTKEKYSLLNIPLSDGSSFIWLADRKPNRKDNQKYHNDDGLKKFIKYNKVSCIAINGNYGKEFASLHCQDIEVIALSHPQQRHLEQMFLNSKYIYQIEGEGIIYFSDKVRKCTSHLISYIFFHFQ